MTFKVKKTSDASVADASKTLVYAHAGFGKTTQAKYLADYYGKTFIISGESGLRSVLSADLDYLPFSSWDGERKARDEKQRLIPVERTSNITELFRRMDMPDSAYESFVASAKAAEPTTTTKE
jgi:hypothetical protein